MVWSKVTYRLKDSGNRVMYYLSDGPPQTVEQGASTSGASPGPERAFVSEELMSFPEDTELPPDYVQE